MAKRSKLDVLLDALRSGDPEARVDALEGLREFPGNRNAYPAVKAAMGDEDRDVRILAGIVLNEYDVAWDSALALAPDKGGGMQQGDAMDPIPPLLKMLKDPMPDERMKAMVQMKMYADPRVLKALRSVEQHDPHRTVRQTAAMFLRQRKAEVEDERTTHFEGHVMVIEGQKARRTAEGATMSAFVDSLGAPWITALGLLLFILGVPGLIFAAGVLVLGPEGWSEMYLNSLGGGSTQDAVAAMTQRLNDRFTDLQYSAILGHGAYLVLGGIGLCLRQEWGRKMVLFYIAVAFMAGYLVAGAKGSIGLGIITAPMVYFLSRRKVAMLFKGHVEMAPAKGPTPTMSDDENQAW